ncbi:hypothetical protein ABPG74_002551 [Tetrahymena malaccensis]
MRIKDICKHILTENSVKKTNSQNTQEQNKITINQSQSHERNQKLLDLNTISKQELEKGNYDISFVIEIGNTLLDRYQLEKAEECFQFVIEKDEKNYQAFIGLGNLYRLQDKFYQSQEYFQKALNLNPTSFETNYYMGSIFLVQDKFEKAKSQYEMALKINPNSPLAYMNLGYIYFQQQLYEKANQYTQKGLQLDPNNFHLIFNFAQSNMVLGNIDLSIQYLNKAIQLNPSSSEAHILLGKLYFSQKKLEEAEKCFKSTLQINPDSSTAKNLLSDLDIAYQVKQKILEDQKQKNEIFAKNFFLEIGKKYEEQNLYIKAQEYYQIAKQIDPNNYLIHLLLAFLYQKFQFLGDPIPFFKEALKANPSILIIHKVLGLNYLLRQQWENAEFELLEYLKDNEQDSQLINTLSIIYLIQNKLNEAEQILIKYLERYPDDIETLLNLAIAYIYKKKYHQAQELLEKIIKINSKNSLAYLYLGNIYLAEQKDVRQASTYFNQAIIEDPKCLEAHIGLARVCIQQQELEKAQKHFNEVLKINNSIVVKLIINLEQEFSGNYEFFKQFIKYDEENGQEVEQRDETEDQLNFEDHKIQKLRFGFEILLLYGRNINQISQNLDTIISNQKKDLQI